MLGFIRSGYFSLDNAFFALGNTNVVGGYTVEEWKEVYNKQVTATVCDYAKSLNMHVLLKEGYFNIFSRKNVPQGNPDWLLGIYKSNDTIHTLLGDKNSDEKDIATHPPPSIQLRCRVAGGDSSWSWFVHILFISHQ